MAVSLPTSHIFCREISTKIQQQQQQQQQHHQQQWANYAAAGHRVPLSRAPLSRRGVIAEAFWQGAAKSTTIEMEPVTSSEHLDQILAEAQELAQPKAIIIDWMANWCRKCIYLKPKLEKLAAEYDTRLKFYYVDVNTVSQALVKRGNITKMPTIQLWKDGEMKEEVIGGHKAWLVIDEVREMIEKYI